MISSRNCERLALCFSALLVVAFGLGSLLSASPTRALWHDETFGIITSVRGVSWAQLWLQGAPGQGSPHPLYYIWEKFFLQWWGPAPQRYWNLFFYFRLTPIFFYALTGGLIFVGSTSALVRALPSARFGLRALIAAALAFFFFKVQFAEYYALEARPYSMWLFLSAVHFFLTLAFVPNGMQRARERGAYALVSALLCMVASPGIFQVGLSFLAIAFPRRIWRDSYTLLPAALIAAFYLRDVGKSGYNTGDFAYYLQCLKEVAFKSFHARNGWVFVPVLLIGSAKLLACGSRDFARRFSAYILGLVALSLFLYGMCLWKGFFLASRQYIYLIPAFLLLYFFALWAVADALSHLRLFGRRLDAGVWLGIWSTFFLVQNVPEFFHRVVTLPAAMAQYHVYGENLGEACVRAMGNHGDSQAEFAELDKACR